VVCVEFSYYHEGVASSHRGHIPHSGPRGPRTGTDRLPRRRSGGPAVSEVSAAVRHRGALRLRLRERSRPGTGSTTTAHVQPSPRYLAASEGWRPAGYTSTLGSAMPIACTQTAAANVSRPEHHIVYKAEIGREGRARLHKGIHFLKPQSCAAADGVARGGGSRTSSFHCRPDLAARRPPPFLPESCSSGLRGPLRDAHAALAASAGDQPRNDAGAGRLRR